MNFLKAVFGWLGAAAFAAVFAVFLTVFVMQPVLVEGSSMENTLHTHDKALIQKVAKSLGRVPEYGAIIVLDSRTKRPRTILDDFSDAFKNNLLSVMLSKDSARHSTYWIKRVIGRPGDTIEIREGLVFRNGEALYEPYIKEPMKTTAGDGSATLGPGEIFVMGDNRNESCDSRSVGPIPLSHVIGSVFFSF